MTNLDKSEARPVSGLFSSKSLIKLYREAIDLIFPPRCQHCGRVDTHFCTVCQAELIAEPIQVMLADIPPMLGVISTGLHAGILQSGVQALKYNGQRYLGKLYANRLKNVLDSVKWEFDIIVPVPLHTTRLQKRGYNQAKEISVHLAELCHCIHDDQTLTRQTQTQSQVGLNRNERIDNVKEAFAVTSSALEGKTILLVDDVKTTGATMVSCAETLLSNGVTSVYGITVTSAV